MDTQRFVCLLSFILHWWCRIERIEEKRQKLRARQAKVALELSLQNEDKKFQEQLLNEERQYNVTRAKRKKQYQQLELLRRYKVCSANQKDRLISVLGENTFPLRYTYQRVCYFSFFLIYFFHLLVSH